MTEHEVWKDILGYEGKYWASSHGRIKNHEKIMKPYKTHDGYYRISLSKKGKKHITVHRLVLFAFVGDGGDKEARHLNGVKTDNRLSNLKWGTAKENSKDRDMHGTTQRGEGHHITTLKESDIIAIRKDERSCGEIAKDYGVSQPTIGNIKRRKYWGHVREACEEIEDE